MSELIVSRRAHAGPRARVLAALLARHRALVAVLVAGAALRAVAVVAIYPGIWFSDSNGYITSAARGSLSTSRVVGYSLLVAPFWQLGSAAALIVLQHLMGLGIAVLLYALLLRRGVPRAWALLGAVPAALDAYLIVVEHAVMSETLYHAALVAGIAALLWNERPGVRTALAGGLLLGLAGIVRSVGVPLIAVVFAYLLVRRVGWRPLAAFCAGAVVVTAGYATAFAIEHGSFGFTESGGRFIYARTAPFADCAKLGTLPADERSLCPDAAHPMTTNEYLWGKTSPLHGLPPSADARIRDFAKRVIRHQPVTYARVVAGGVLHYFEPGHRIGANDYPVAPWQFPADPLTWGYPGYRGPIRHGDPARHARHPITEPSQYVGAMVSHPRLDVGASRFLHGYQRYVYTWGPLLALCVLAVLAALVTRRGAWRLRLDAALLASLVIAALAVSQALSVFSYRYGLIAAVLLPAAAALAVTALRGVPYEE